MEEKKEESSGDTGTESKLVKNFRRIFMIIFSLGAIILIYKLLIDRFG